MFRPVGHAADLGRALTAITSRSAVELAAAIRARELTSSEVVQAHIALHQRVAPRINAVVAERYEVARHEATVVDELINAAASDDELPPLLGVPFTVKESIAVAGLPQSAGLLVQRF